MASAQEYRRQIKNLGLERLEIQASSSTEAKEVLRKLRALQKELRQIKKNINLDMKGIRAVYQQRMSTAAATSSTVVSLFGKRKLAGQLRADEKRRLRMERDRKLQPYESIKLAIDGILTQIDNAKIKLQAFIEEVKTKEQAKKETAKPKSASKNYCPQCGAQVSKSDKFCRECGHML